jgi:hypothetical protein
LIIKSESLEITVIGKARRGLNIDLKSSRNLQLRFSRLLEKGESAFLF